MITKKEKNENDLRQRLRTSWRKVYRTLIRADETRSGFVRMQEFIDSLHHNKCFISREETLKLQKKYGNSNYTGTDPNDKLNQINYEYLSKDMGLHHSYLDFIQKN